jgi:putative transposase
MIYPVVRELAADGVAVATACRVLQVSTSGYYIWRDHPNSSRDQANLELVEVIKTIHADSRGTYGAPRVHAELRLGAPKLAVSRKRVERLMRVHGIVGVHRRRRGGDTRRDPAASPNADLVERRFRPRREVSCGAATSPSSAPAKAGCTARSSSTSTPAA